MSSSSAARRVFRNAVGSADIPLPRALCRADLPIRQDEYVVSIKADGTRVSLVFYRDAHGAAQLYMIERGHRAMQLGTSGFDNSLFAGTVLDCELCEDQLWVFDCYQICGNRLYARESYPRRMAIVTELIHKWYEKDPTPRTPSTWESTPIRVLKDRKSMYVSTKLPKCVPALYIHVKPLFHVNQSANVLKDKYPFKTDGLVYTPIRSDAMPCLKYKSDHTVDFYIGPSKYPDCVTLLQYNGLSKNHNAFASARVPAESKDKVKMGSVWECMYTNEEWTLDRHRPDKRKANESRTVADTMRCVHEGVQPSELVARRP